MTKERPTLGYNANSPVWAKLNAYGYYLLAERHNNRTARHGNGIPRTDDWFRAGADEDGYRKFYLWEFMETFGPSLNIGKAMPFDSELRFEQSKLSSDEDQKKTLAFRFDDLAGFLAAEHISRSKFRQIVREELTKPRTDEEWAALLKSIPRD